MHLHQLYLHVSLITKIWWVYKRGLTFLLPGVTCLHALKPSFKIYVSLLGGLFTPYRLNMISITVKMINLFKPFPFSVSAALTGLSMFSTSLSISTKSEETWHAVASWCIMWTVLNASCSIRRPPRCSTNMRSSDVSTTIFNTLCEQVQTWEHCKNHQTVSFQGLIKAWF